MSIAQLSLLIFVAICIKTLARASPYDAYKFEELIKIKPFIVNDLSEDLKLKYDYDFIFPENKEIKINERDEEWNDVMSDAMNRIKNARIKQRDLYLEMKAAEKKKDWRQAKMLRTEIEEEDDTVDFYMKVCNSYGNESWKNDDPRFPLGFLGPNSKQ